MIAYLIRRLLYAVPILLGVNLITFALFFMVNTPDDMARIQLGAKHVTAEAIARWKVQHGYDKPLFYNAQAEGGERLTQTLFTQKSLSLFALEFGQADDGRSIAREIQTRMWPSLAVAMPTFFIGLAVYLATALMLVFFRRSRLELAGVVMLVVLMSISGLFYVIGGQFVLGKLWHWAPISGYAPGLEAWKFLVLPVLVGVVSGIGESGRFYRALFLEEIHQDYVRTARAKGLSEARVLFNHILPNAAIPILTGVVVVLPRLFLGSLVIESFFGVPGLGSYTIDAIQAQDFGIVRAMVFLGSLLYIVGLVLTDLSYTLVDPRVRLQ
ncbi:MAG: ABC transporter permease [Betaproteobacteria bacterium]|nr:MAG: ABC transporter permease [Betaproteobacteria bacterium]